MSEDKIKLITAIAQSLVNGQEFHSDALAFLSQPKTTLNRYSGGGGYKLNSGYSHGGYRLDGGSSHGG